MRVPHKRRVPMRGVYGSRLVASGGEPLRFGDGMSPAAGGPPTRRWVAVRLPAARRRSVAVACRGMLPCSLFSPSRHVFPLRRVESLETLDLYADRLMAWNHETGRRLFSDSMSPVPLQGRLLSGCSIIYEKQVAIMSSSVQESIEVSEFIL